MPVNIPTAYFPLFRSVGHVRQLPSGSTIFTQGDPATNLYLVTRGRLRVFTLSAAGQETTLEILNAGRVFGDASFLSGSSRCATIETVLPSEVVVCPTDTLLPLCQESQELMMLMFQQMTETCNYLTHQITRLVSHDSRQKVADFLLSEAARRDLPAKGATLSYTQDQIAQSVSLNRVTVSRILTEFRSNGWISSQYRSISVLDPDALAALLPEAHEKQQPR